MSYKLSNHYISLKKKLKNRGVQRYGQNTLWMLSEKILRMTIGLIVGVWVARYLGPEKFGLLSYAQSYVAIFSVIATLGLDGIVVRDLVKDKTKQNVILGSAFVLKIIGSLSVLLLISLSLFFYPGKGEVDLLIFVIASTTIIQSFNVIDFYFQSRVQGKYIALSNAFSLAISSVIKVMLIINNANVEFFAYVIFCEMFFLSTSFLYFYFKKEGSIFKWRFRGNEAYRLLKDSWPLILSSLVVTLYMRVDQIMLNNMIGSMSVGYYAAATRLSEVWYFIPVVVCNSLFPAILNAKGQSEEVYLLRLEKLNELMLWSAVCIAILVSFISEPIIEVLYGSEFHYSSGILTIHIWSSVFVFLGVVSSKWFIAEGLQKFTFYRTLVGAILNVILNYFLIDFYGAYGAAFATLISQMVASYLFNALNEKTKCLFAMQNRAMLLPFRLISSK